MSDADESRADADRELHLLAHLDGIGDAEAWAALVRWMAPKMAAENPKLLTEIVVRRALKRVGVEAYPRQAEMIAQQFGWVGLKLVPA